MRIKQGFSLRKVGNENVIVAVESHLIDFCRIISLNDTAARLWEELQNKEFDIETVAILLERWYHINGITAAHDARNILSAWKAAGLME